MDKTLYRLLGASDTRVWTHAGLTRESARALREMRPEPSFHVVVGGTTFIMDTYGRVSVLYSTCSMDKTLYRLVGASDMRVLTHTGLMHESARALRDMRPEPSLHVVGRTTFIIVYVFYLTSRCGQNTIPPAAGSQ